MEELVRRAKSDSLGPRLTPKLRDMLRCTSFPTRRLLYKFSDGTTRLVWLVNLPMAVFWMWLFECVDAYASWETLRTDKNGIGR